MAKVVDQLENPPSILKTREHDELSCPKCEDLFKLSGYKVAMVKVWAWKLAQSRQGRIEIPTTKSMEEEELELNINPDQELQEHEEIQFQPLKEFHDCWVPIH